VIAENYYLIERVFWLMFLVGSCGNGKCMTCTIDVMFY